jgi:hypothetical protein
MVLKDTVEQRYAYNNFWEVFHKAYLRNVDSRLLRVISETDKREMENMIVLFRLYLYDDGYEKQMERMQFRKVRSNCKKGLDLEPDDDDVGQ